jgi:peptidoglycan hydrolase-like protein with peptidoglycan-binding domain
LRPIRQGDRGPAVEDVQRRLLQLGVDLGATGVDGVFLGATCAAVTEFQAERGLTEDGEVGPLTWASLVDATFQLGDRLLYLRYPYLHGEDVRSLQAALNGLGFTCGAVDGIFGAFTERAVREFQANTGLDADGILGPDTARMVSYLRHVWADRTALPPADLQAGPARCADILSRIPVIVVAAPGTEGLADRLVNLALASEPRAMVRRGADASAEGVTIELGAAPARGTPVVIASGDSSAIAGRMASALASADALPASIEISLGELPSDEHALQALAVALLDGLCLGLAAPGRPVVI